MYCALLSDDVLQEAQKRRLISRETLYDAARNGGARLVQRLLRFGFKAAKNRNLLAEAVSSVSGRAIDTARTSPSDKTNKHKQRKPSADVLRASQAS
jgi:hypothetical protein